VKRLLLLLGLVSGCTKGDAVTLTDANLYKADDRRRPDRRPRREGSLLRSIVPLTFSSAVIVAVVIGWLQRNDGHLTPEHGTGYWLGMVGGIAMLLLLLYPLRKRFRMMRAMGSVPSWFRIHMVLGILGPVLILFHANFKLGSANSNVALFSMLLVAGSGIIGRYLYAKIHLGLYGRKSDVAECLAEAQALVTELTHRLSTPSEITSALDQFATFALAPKKGILSGIWLLLRLRWKAMICREQMMRRARVLIANEAKERGWTWGTRRRRTAEARNCLIRFFRAVRKAAAFAVYERLFALWHILHLPLFILLVLTTTLHVIAVHTY
jgi:hypothetical protein